MAIQKVTPGSILKVTVTSTGATDWFRLNNRLSPFELKVGVFKDGASSFIAKLEYSMVDDPINDTSEHITEHALGGNITESTDFGFSSSPINVVRLNVTSLSGGNLGFYILQSGT